MLNVTKLYSFNVSGFWLHFLVPPIFFAGFEVLTALYPRMPFWGMILSLGNQIWVFWGIAVSSFTGVKMALLGHSASWRWWGQNVLFFFLTFWPLKVTVFCFRTRSDYLKIQHHIPGKWNPYLCVCVCVWFPDLKFFLFKDVVSVTVFFSIPVFIHVVHNSNHNLPTSSCDWFIWFFSVSSGEFQEIIVKLMELLCSTFLAVCCPQIMLFIGAAWWQQLWKVMKPRICCLVSALSLHSSAFVHFLITYMNSYGLKYFEQKYCIEI